MGDTSVAAGLLTAIRFAAEKHKRQRRKDADASPYINHPIEVAAELAVRGDASTICHGQSPKGLRDIWAAVLAYFRHA